MVSPSPGPWMAAPPVVYKWGPTSTYVDTGPYREYGVTLVPGNGINPLGYSLNQYATIDKEADSGTISDGLPASYHYSGGLDEMTSGTGAVSRGGGQVSDYVAHYLDGKNATKYETYTGFSHWVALRPDDFRHRGFSPLDWSADFWDIAGVDGLIGYEVTGAFGMRRYLDYDACEAAGPDWVAVWDAWSADTSSLGETAYWQWDSVDSIAYATCPGWDAGGDVRVYGDAPGSGQVCWASTASLPVATENPQGGKRRVPPSAAFSGTVVSTTDGTGGTWESPNISTWSFTVPYKGDPWVVFTNWSVAPPFGLTVPTHGWNRVSSEADVTLRTMEGTITSPWQYRYLYATAGVIPNLTGRTDLRLTRSLMGRQ